MQIIASRRRDWGNNGGGDDDGVREGGGGDVVVIGYDRPFGPSSVGRDPGPWCRVSPFQSRHVTRSPRVHFVSPLGLRPPVLHQDTSVVSAGVHVLRGSFGLS